MLRRVTLVILAVTVFAVTLTSVSTRTQPPSHLDEMKLKGNVKSLMVSNKTSNINKNLNSKTIYSFNEYGMLTEVLQLHNHELVSKITYNYNDENVLLSCKDYDDNGYLFLKINFRFDENNFPVEEKIERYFEDEYYKNKQKISGFFKEYYKKPFTKIIYKCDFKGYIMEKKYYLSDGNLSHKYTYKYDFKYNLTESNLINSENVIIQRRKYRYNKTGDVLQSKTFINNRLSTTSSFTYEYDSKQNWEKRYEIKNIEKNEIGAEFISESTYSEHIIEYY